jgi:carbamoyltransferase
MNVLGISCFYHDAASCLIRDGKIIAAAEEERFTRKKHDIDFPINAIKYCLDEGKITVNDIDYIGFYEKPFLKFERLLMQHLDKWPLSFNAFQKSMPSWLGEKLNFRKQVQKKLGYNGEVLFVDHHLSHAASSYLVSPFKEAAILTTDGVGEWSTTTCGFGKGNNITLTKEIRFPHSLGLLYSTITAYLGFSVNNSEYKVMGLAAYGKPNYYDEFLKMIKINDDGSYSLDLSYFVYHYKLTMPSKKLEKLLGPCRKKEGEMEQRHKDIAASLQKVTEEVLFKMLGNLHNETKMRNLCMAGGVALNSVANGKIKDNTAFRNIFIQPAAGDSGGSLGVAAYISSSYLGKDRPKFSTPYLGPGFDTDSIKSFLDENKIKYSAADGEADLAKKAAKLIFSNNVVGWFQGRMEWGPRALGNRSILSNACNPNMQHILNEKVKHREKFRPFAPVILEEHVKEYFDINKDSEPYMLFVYPIKKNKQKIIPAVTHADGTGRLQTISKEQNPRYYNVIREFQKLSGVPVLINTSFNIRGEPIVCTPKDAYRCMMGTAIDYLIMDKFIISRQNNLKDAWNSEASAHD